MRRVGTRCPANKIIKVDVGCVRVKLNKSFCTYHINLDLLNLETENNRPNQTQDEAGIAVDNVFRTDRFQSNLYSHEKDCLQVYLSTNTIIVSSFNHSLNVYELDIHPNKVN